MLKEIKLKGEDLIKDINEGLSYREIATRYDVRIENVRKRAQYYGLSKDREPSGITRELFIRELSIGKSLREIADNYNIKYKTLCANASRWGILQENRFKYTINTEKLLNPLDPVTNYLAGLIATDGYLHPKHERIDINLVGSSERDLLTDLMRYYGSDIPVKKLKYAFNTKGRYGIGITARGVREFFSDNFNIPIRNKTYDLGFPSFSNESLAKMFLRGCFDGDGSINSNSGRLMILTASETFISGLRDLIVRYLGIPIAVNHSREYPALYYNVNNALKILEWLYDCKPDIRLKRKYQIYLQLRQVSQ